MEIEAMLSEKRILANNLNKQLRSLNVEISQLNDKLVKTHSDLFIEYLNLNEPIKLKRYASFSGIQVNIKDTPKLNNNTNIWRSSFSTDDVIQVIKKNKRSVIIRCISLRTSKIVDGKREIQYINPESEFRIDVDTFRNYMLQDSDFYKAFTTWIKRKVSLDSLLD